MGKTFLWNNGVLVSTVDDGISTPQIQNRAAIIEALPDSAMMAWRDSVNEQAVKQYAIFGATDKFDKALGTQLANFLSAKSIITAGQASAFIAAWPEA